MDKKMKQSMLLIAFGVVLYVGLTNFSYVLLLARNFMRMILPILIGAILAFMLSVPINGFEKLIGKLCQKTKIKMKKKTVTMTSFLLTILSILFVLAIVFNTVIPEIVTSVKGIVVLIQHEWPKWALQLKAYDIDTTEIANWVENLDIQHLFLGMVNNAGGMLNHIAGTAMSTISTLVSVLLAIVVMIYILLSKDELLRQTKKLLYANVKKEHADRVVEVAALARDTYSKFLSGQCIEAMILGGLMFITFSIFGLPYAGLIAILTAVCAFVPFIGAFISCGVGVVLTLLTNPIQAVVCLIVYLVVQFIENQFIYPRVVGTSVGLSPFWTFIAVLLGGKLFGLVGILFFIPLTAVLYSLIRDNTNRKLADKKVCMK